MDKPKKPVTYLDRKLVIEFFLGTRGSSASLPPTQHYTGLDNQFLLLSIDRARFLTTWLGI
jgi:hypothetical protein